MLKNITIGQITIILTVFLGLVNIVTLVILYLTGATSNFPLLFWFGVLVISLIAIYVVIKFFLENFVLGKIKIIYKMIGDSKQSSSLQTAKDIDDKSITSVNEEVMEWAQKRKNEIEDLTKLENYRRNFLGNISHELKTPIFSIQGYVHTLLEGGIYDEAVNIKYLQKAASNLDRLQNIVDDLEMINRLESGKLTLRKEDFNLQVLVKEVMEDLLFMAEDAEISLTLKQGASSAFQVHADLENIRQLLSNLISNSIKYGKEGGNVIIGFYDMVDKVLIEIEDDGIGIDEKHLNHLFDRFYRVDESRSRKHGGSGLGLSIVKHILEAHNQSINVRSEVGKGTIFGFTLDKS